MTTQYHIDVSSVTDYFSNDQIIVVLELTNNSTSAVVKFYNVTDTAYMTGLQTTVTLNAAFSGATTKIALISDPHIASSASYSNFIACIDAIDDDITGCSKVFVLGDIVNDDADYYGSGTNEYKTARATSDISDSNWHELAGNHDILTGSSGFCAELLGGESENPYYSVSVDNCIFIFISDEGSFAASNDANAFISTTLAANTSNNCFILTHEPRKGTTRYSKYNTAVSQGWLDNVSNADSDNWVAWFAGHSHGYTTHTEPDSGRIFEATRDEEYTKYQTITIEHTLVAATEVDATIEIPFSLFDSTTNVFDTCRTDGGDIEIRLNDGSTKLARHIIKIDTGAKTGRMKIRVPSSGLSSATDLVLRAYYNGLNTEPYPDSTYGSEEAYRPAYVVSYPMIDDPNTASIADATGNDHNGAKISANEPNEVTTGQDFDGVDDDIRIPDNADFNFTDGSDLPFSISATIAPASVAGVDWIVTKDGHVDASNWNREWVFYISDGKLTILCVNGDNSANVGRRYNTALSVGTTYRVKGTYDGSEAASGFALYIDGVAVDDTDIITNTYAGMTAGNRDVMIGYWDDFNDTKSTIYAGIIGNVDITDIEETATWAETEDNFLNSAASFYAVSDEQIDTGSTLLPINFTFPSDYFPLGYWTKDYWQDLAVTGLELLLSDTVNLSDEAIKAAGITKSDTITLSDNVSKSAQVILSDAIALNDDFSSIITLILALNDTINTSDSIVKGFSLVKSDIVSLSDNFSKVFAFIKSFSDTITLNDDILKSVSLALSDSVTLLDDFNKLITLILSLNDTINTSDSIVKETGVNKADIINLSDNVNIITEFFRTYSDSVNISDNISKIFGLNKLDIINLSDEFSTSTATIYALLNFIAQNKTFNFIAQNKTFNFNAKSRG